MSVDNQSPEVERTGPDSGMSDESLRAAKDIDRQMKELAEMNTRVLIAKDQLADIQELIQAKVAAFQEQRAAGHADGHADILQSIRDARDEAARHIRESKAINDAYEKLLKQLEKGRETALRETRRAEAVFKEKFHEAETSVLKKAGEIRESLKKK